MTLLLALALALAILDCEGERPPTSPSEPATLSPAEPLDALSRRLGRVRKRLRERGYRETGWALRLFLPAQTARAETVRIRRNVCTTFLALAGGSMRELELALYDSDGRRAAVDSVPGEGSLVHACPRGEGGTSSEALYYLKVRAARGAGAVAIRAFESPVGFAAGVDGIFDGVLAPPEHGDGVAVRIQRTLNRLGSRGMNPVGEPVISRVLEGEALRHGAPLEAGRCYVAVARSEDSVKDVALYLLDPSGAEVARDLDGRDEPRVEHCPDETGTYLIDARAAEGSGGIGLALVLDPNAAPAEESEPPTRVDPAPTPGRVRDAVSALIARGYSSPRYLLRGAALRPGELVTRDVQLPAGCSVLLAAPESSDMDLDLYLTELQGEPISSDTRITAEARLATCRDRPSLAHATVKAYGSGGTFALVLLGALEGASDVRHVRLLEAVAPFASRGYERDTVEEIQLGEGEERVFYFDAPAGSCFLAAAAGGEGLEDMDLVLRIAGNDRILASDTGPDAWASVSRCAEVTERLELRVVAYRGSGTALFQSMRRGH